MERYAKRCLFWAVPALLAAFSCEKVDNPLETLEEPREQLVLELTETKTEAPDTRCDFTVTEEDIWFSVETRAVQAVTTVANTNIVWGAVTPSGVWSPVRTGADGSGKVYTGKYVNGTGSNNTYYVTNSGSASDLTLTTSSATLSVSRSNPANGTDLVVGKATSSAANVSLALDHIFARTGTFTFTTPSVSGLSVSNVSWSIKSHDSSTGIAGTYNINSGAWTNIPSQLAATTVNSNSDFYLIPGDYDITVSCTVTMNGSSQNLSRTGTVSFSKGKINNITAGLGSRYELIISPTSSSINVGATQSYTVSLKTWLRFGSNDVASFQNTVSSGLSWNSSNTGIATVSSGTATGVSAGTATITAYYTPSGSSQLSASATLTVSNVTSQDYELIISPSQAQLAVGYTRTYSATLRTWTLVNGQRTTYTDTALQNSQVTWSSSNTSRATISNSSGHQGEVTGVSAGAVTITGRYTPSGSTQRTGTASLTVVASGGNQNWDDSWNNGGETPLN